MAYQPYSRLTIAIGQFYSNCVVASPFLGVDYLAWTIDSAITGFPLSWLEFHSEPVDPSSTGEGSLIAQFPVPGQSMIVAGGPVSWCIPSGILDVRGIRKALGVLPDPIYVRLRSALAPVGGFGTTVNVDVVGF